MSKEIASVKRAGKVCETTYADGSRRITHGNGITQTIRADGGQHVTMRFRPGGRETNPITRTFTGATAFEDALRERAKIVRAKQLGEDVIREEEAARITLYEFCDSWFWPEYVMTELAPRTRSGYATQLDKRIIPYFGRTPLRQIKRRDIKKWRNDLLACGDTPVSVNAAVAVLRSILTQALEEEFLDQHPAMRLRPLPEVKSSRRDARDPVTVELVRAAIADASEDEPEDVAERQCYVSLLEHGLRPSEAIALRYGDVIAPSGVPRGTILVQRAASGDRSEPIKPTKNNRRREVAFYEFVQNEVLELWKTHGMPDRDELIFRQPDGRPWHNPTHYYGHWWAAALLRVGVKPFVVYDLRHTAASYQLLTMKHADVARQLGHSVATNQKTYDHPLGREADRWLAAAARRVGVPRKVLVRRSSRGPCDHRVRLWGRQSGRRGGTRRSPLQGVTGTKIWSPRSSSLAA